MGLYSYLLLIASGLLSSLDCSSLNTCDRPQADQSAWYSNRMDKYLENYPGRNGLTFQDGYLSGLEIHELSCHTGMEAESLTKGQMCNPSINDSDWLVLKSVENWIEYANSLSMEIDQIGSGLLDDVVAKLSSFLSPTDEALTLPSRLRRRSLIKSIIEHPYELPREAQKVPPVYRLVPESSSLSPTSRKLPSIWVRASRYVQELIRRGGQYFTKRPHIPYRPSEVRPAINPEEGGELSKIQAQKQAILQKWWEAQSKQPQEKSRNEKEKAVDFQVEWKNLARREHDLTNELLRKEAQETIDKYAKMLIELESAKDEPEMNGLEAQLKGIRNERSITEPEPSPPQSDDGIRPPPPPILFTPKKISSSISANLAFEANNVRDLWSGMYRVGRRGKFPEEKDEKRWANAFARTQAKWDKLYREYEIVRRIEFLQEAIGKHASKKRILKALSRTHDDAESPPKLTGEQNVGFANHQNGGHSPDDERESSSLHKRDSHWDPRKLNKLAIQGHEKDLILVKTKTVISKNMNHIIKAASLSDGIFPVIRKAQFVSPVDSHLVVQDLQLLIELGLISRLLENMHTSIVINLSKTCDPERFQPEMNDESATFCSLDGFMNTIFSEKRNQKDQEPLSLKELGLFVSSSGYQLSDLINMSLACKNSRDKDFNENVLPTTESNSFSRLNPISVCVIDVPVTYLMN